MSDGFPGGEPLSTVSKGTQYERNRFDFQRLFACLAKALIIFCGILSLYTLYHIFSGTMPCACSNMPSRDSVTKLARIVRLVLDVLIPFWLVPFWITVYFLIQPSESPSDRQNSSILDVFL